MSIFGSIVSAIFGHASAAGATPTAGSSTAPTSSTAAGSPTGKPMTKAEVEAMIEKLADAQDEQYDWEESIVDLMKLLKLDSSLTARKQLAQELGYTGALNGSAEMNIWLHQQVMTKLAESGGKVPDSLKK
jgi:Rieske Fe-S protein